MKPYQYLAQRALQLGALVASSIIFIPVSHSSPLFSLGDSVNVFFDGSLTSSYRTNVFSSVDAQDDFVTIFSPGLSFEAGSNSLADFKVVFREDIIRYSSFKEQDVENFNVFGSGSYETEKLRLKLNSGFQQVSDNSGNINRDGIIVDRDIVSFGFEAEYDVTPKTYVELGGAYRSEEYTNDLGNFFSDQYYYQLPLNFLYRFSEKLSVGLGYRYRETDVDANAINTTGNVFEDHFGNLALRYNALKWNARVNLGVQNREPDYGVGTTDFSINSGFGYQLTPKTVLDFAFDRDFSSGGNGRSVEDTGVSLGGRWNYSEFISLAADFRYIYSDFDQAGSFASREDDRITSRLNFTYSPQKYVTVGAGYAFDKNDSSITANDYESHSFNLSARFRY